MTAATSVFDVTGEITVTSTRRSTPIALTQTIPEMIARHYEVLVAHASTVPVVLDFPAGVEEILVLHIYSPSKVKVSITTNDIDDPGPVTFGMKGDWFLTLAPETGITALSFTNDNATLDVVVNVTTGTVASADDTDPTFWKDTDA